MASAASLGTTFRTRNVYKAKRGTLKARVSELDTEIGMRFSKLIPALDSMFLTLGTGPEQTLAIFQRLVAQLFSNIVEATPVDTGQARASWRIEAIERRNTFQWLIKNGVPYIVFLEFGSSSKAPKGMVRINLDKFIRDARTGTRRALKRKSRLK